MRERATLSGPSPVSSTKKGPSRMAESIALQRAGELRRPEDERICHDPYSARFVRPEVLALAARDPERVKAETERLERLFPGLSNSIRARVRYFDDYAQKAATEGIEQLVLLGAGYDTRAYRIEGLKKLRVFEIDHPDTQDLKIRKVREIFGSLPEHVSYVPVDFEVEKFGEKLVQHGYDRSKKTLFVAEGLLMYLPPEAVDETLAFIVQNSGRGSEVLFDYYLSSVLEGTTEVGRNIRDYTSQVGEPQKFGIGEGALEAFLRSRGFSGVGNVTAEDYRRLYFHGKNAALEVCSLLLFAHAKTA